MAFDGCFLHKIISELSCLQGGFIDKIHQPSRDELNFVLRTKSGAHRLLISANPQNPRIQTTKSVPENPATPPMFCMLLRKHIGSGVLVNITQPELERIAILEFSATNEMGDRVIKYLVAEFIGTSPNIILCDNDFKIIDAIRKSDIENETARMIQPGVTYTLPTTEKHSILSCDREIIVQKIMGQEEKTISAAIVSVLSGVSPKTAAYLCGMCDIDANQEIKTLNNDKIILLRSTLKSSLLGDTVAYKNDKDYTFLKANGFYAADCSLSSLLDSFHSEQDKLLRISSKLKELTKIVSNLIKRSERKLALRRKELEKCKDRESLRLYGELIKANLHTIRSGDSFAEVVNYYDPNLATVKIPLDVALSPQNNAAKYFKEYKKACTAEQMLSELILQNIDEINYLESVFESLNRADSVSLLDAIREELSITGYLRLAKSNTKKNKNSFALQTEESPSGFKVIIGRNNIQNDYITTKLSAKHDLWFHTKNIPGSHVVIETGGKEVPAADIVFAANLAAKYSKAANSSKVPVDYTQIKNVKKPTGAKPGMVIYKTNSTILVDPTKN